MISGRVAVKHSNLDYENPGKRQREAPVWLRGWPLAIPSVGVALVAAVLAIPRSTKPSMVPQPLVHVWELNGELDQLKSEARSARSQPLSFAIREVGEAYRRFGRTQFDGPQLLDDTQAWRLRQLVQSALKQSGDAQLLALRAVQVQMFVASLSDWDKGGTVPADLAELGGDFVALARRNLWRSKEHLEMLPEERWALGLLRWTTLTGLLGVPAFRLPRNLEVVQLRFFFTHPQSEESAPALRQRILKRYSELEPDYPAEYAKGVLAAQTGQFELAAACFSRQLEAHPQGNYVVRTRNHLIWAAAQVRALGSGSDNP